MDTNRPRHTVNHRSYYTLRQASWTFGIDSDELACAIRRSTIRTERRRSALVITGAELARHLQAASSPPEPWRVPPRTTDEAGPESPLRTLWCACGATAERDGLCLTCDAVARWDHRATGDRPRAGRPSSVRCRSALRREDDRLARAALTSTAWGGAR